MDYFLEFMVVDLVPKKSKFEKIRKFWTSLFLNKNASYPIQAVKYFVYYSN